MAHSDQAGETPAEPGPAAPGPTNCVESLVVEDGAAVVIYEENQSTDRFTHGTGWIKSDTTVPLTEAR